MNYDNVKQSFDTVSEYISEEYEKAVEKVYERFAEKAGTDDPETFKNEGYQIYQIKRNIRANEMIREAYVLVRGDRVISGIETSVISSPQINIKSFPLSKEEVKTLLNSK